MARYCDGDATAFREFYDDVAPRLFGYLIKLARDRSVAADLVQQTFMKLHRARAMYIHGADPLPWMFSIAHRTFIDHVRKARRDMVSGLRVDRDFDDIASVEREDDARVEPALMREAVAALALLSRTQREAVVLTHLEGRTVAEAARIAGTTPVAMRVRAHRGRKALHELLVPHAVVLRSG